MNYFSKCASRLTTGLFAATLALSLAPVGQAQSAVQAAGDSSAAPAAAAKTQQQQLEDLQREMSVLEQQIAALKAQQESAPALVAAKYVQTPAAAAPDKVSISSLLGPTTISGFVDAYYGYNYNHPVNNISGWRFFDGPTNGFSLNMVELIADKAPDPATPDTRFGYHVAAGYGNAAAVVNGTDPAAIPSTIAIQFPAQFYLKEAYGQYLVGKALTIQVGKFVTPIGAEVIETNGNMNYSRGLLFYYAIPYFHFGANAKYAFNSKFATTFYLVNGWNNSAIFHDLVPNGVNSSGMTYGVSAAYTPNAKWSAIENYFAGPVMDAVRPNGGTVNDYKQLSDTVLSYTPNAKWSFTINGDYGWGPIAHPVCTNTSCPSVGPKATWWGTAGYVKYTMGAKDYLAMRYEYYGDPQGYSGLVGGPGHGQEVTTTYSHNVTSGLQVRAEYRYDFASAPIFARTTSKVVKEQNTATLGLIYSFSSANAK